MKYPIKIGSRKSELALRQTAMVIEKLNEAGIPSTIITITSNGDLSQNTNELITEGTGVFTKAIDDAILNGEIDMGVHSVKDMPTKIHEDLVLACVLERADPRDILIFNNHPVDLSGKTSLTIATGSVRRWAQWLYRFPEHHMVPVRGNVDSRIIKLKDNLWDGMILALAGIQRLQLQANFEFLDWIIPAPGQGIIGIVVRKDNKTLRDILSGINHLKTMIAGKIEKQFLSYMGSGCSIPVGALVTVSGDQLNFQGEILNKEGTKKIEIKLKVNINNADELAEMAFEYAVKNGSETILKS